VLVDLLWRRTIDRAMELSAASGGKRQSALALQGRLTGQEDTMPMIVTRRYSARVSRSAWKAQRCESCQTQFAYQVTREFTGQGVSPFGQRRFTE